MKRRDFIKWNAVACAAAATPAALSMIDFGRISFRQPKAKSVVVLYMVGGPSQMDLFDYKPDLYKYNGMTLGEKGLKPARIVKHQVITKPLKTFKQYGECGQWVSEFFPNMAKLVDDLAMIKSFTAKEENHTQGQLEFCTGVTFPGHPCVGAWMNYALNRPLGNLPQSFLLTDPKGYLRIGDLAWKTHPLPTANSIFKFSDWKTTIQLFESAKTDQEFVNLFAELNKYNSTTQGFENLSNDRLADFRLIYSMREPIMDTLNLSNVSTDEKKMYGLDDPLCKKLGEQLIIARRLVEQEVPFIKIFCGNNIESQNWDHHVNIGDIVNVAHMADKPITGFMQDMKQRGLLENAVVVWAGEFGREPGVDPQIRGSNGRSHNINAGTIWLAGAGIKKGISFGETDELSMDTVSNRIEMGDVWATLFHLMGVDHQKLSFPSHIGAKMRLTRSYHRVLHEILA